MTKKTRRLLFIAPTALNGLVTLLSIPVLISTAGTEKWAAFAVGQAVGSIGLTLVSFGWGVTGPATIAGREHLDRARELCSSVAVRTAIFVPTAGTGMLASGWIAQTNATTAMLSCLATTAIGLNAVWYFVGTSDPISLLITDTLPKTTLVLAGLSALLLGAPTNIFPSLQFVGIVIGLVVSTWSITRGLPRRSLISAYGYPAVVTAFKSQRSGVTSAMLSSAFSSAPLPLVNLVAPGATVAFAVVDKVQKQLTTAATPFGNMVVAESAALMKEPRSTRAVSARYGLRTTLRMALGGGVATAFASWPLLEWISANTVKPSILLCVSTGIIVSATFGLKTLPPASLAALGRVYYSSATAIVGLLVGLPAIAVSTKLWDVSGAVVSTAVVTAVLVSGLSVAIWFRARPDTSVTPTHDGYCSLTGRRSCTWQ